MLKDNLDHAQSELQIKRMQEATSKRICCFCREYFEEYHSAPVEFENDSCLISRNDFPYPGTVRHYLIVMKRHILFPFEISQKEWNDFYTILSDFNQKYPHPGGALVMRFGDPSYTGATLVHLHAHIIHGAQGKPGDEQLTAYIGYRE